MTTRPRSRDSAREILDALVRDVQRSEFRPLSAEYLRAVDRVEKLPANHTGADKSWVLRRYGAAMRVRSNAKRIR